MNVHKKEKIVDDLDRIYTWIDQVPLSRPKKCIARDFSDGVLMAELLKRYYPRLVDLHNYIPGNSIAKKIDNWCTLNRKVLSKLNMTLGKDVIDRLAASQPGTIEKVLAGLHTKISKDRTSDSDCLFAEFEEISAAETTEPIMKLEAGEDDIISRSVLRRLKRELCESNDTVTKLREKITHLESLLKLKDERIRDLSARVAGPLDSYTTT